MSCQWQRGLLVMQECGEPATGACGICGRMLCMAHTVPGANGMACPQCASQNEGYEETEDTEMAETRGEYYQRYGEGTQFGQPGFFTPSDSAALGSRGLPPVRREKAYDPKES